VPSGPGTQGLTRQGLDQQVANADAQVQGPGKVQLTVRAVNGLDMVELDATHLQPTTRYTAYGQHGNEQIPLLTFTTDPKGDTPQALAFLQFFGVYNPTTLTVRPDTTSGATGATGSANGDTGSTVTPVGGAATGAGSTSRGRDTALLIGGALAAAGAVAAARARRARHPQQP